MGNLSSISTDNRPRGREPSQSLYYVILIGLAFFVLAPLMVLVFNSLKTSAQLGRNPLGPPLAPVFANFPQAWELGNFAVTMRNSTIITLGTVIGVCVIAGTAAYALSRLDLPGGDGVLFYLFVGSAVPVQLFLVPLFFLWSRLRPDEHPDRGHHHLLGHITHPSRHCSCARTSSPCRVISRTQLG